MKANELRIGNLINDYEVNEGYFIIEEIKKNEQGNLAVYYRGGSCMTIKPEPIPLTEDILLKCGFEKIPHFTITNSLIKKIGRNRYLSFGCIGTPNATLWLYYMEDKQYPLISDLVCLYNYDYDKTIYLHQLQNLYFALTKQELEVNL